MDDTRTEDLRQMKCALLRALGSLNATLGPRDALETEDDPSRGVWLFEDGDDDFYAEAGGGPMLAGYVRGGGDGWTVFNPDGTVNEVASGPETGAKARRLVEEAWNKACLASPEYRSKAREGDEEPAAGGEARRTFWWAEDVGDDFYEVVDGKEKIAGYVSGSGKGWEVYKGPGEGLYAEGPETGLEGRRLVERAVAKMRAEQREEPGGEEGTLAERLAKLEHDLGGWSHWNFTTIIERLDDLDRSEGNLGAVLEEHDSRISAGEEHHRAKFDNLNLRLAGLEAKLGLWGSVHFAEHHERLDDLDRRMGNAHDRMDGIEDEAVKAGIVANKADERASIANARQVAVERRLSEVVERLEKLESLEEDVDWRFDRLSADLKNDKARLRRVIEIVEARLDGFSVDEYPVSGKSRGLLRILDGEAEDV